jgi:hypothetical protein
VRKSALIAGRGKEPPCPDRSGRDDGPRDLSPDPQGFRSSGPRRSGRGESLPYYQEAVIGESVELGEKERRVSTSGLAQRG